jgi:hypothetical protein
MIKFLLIIGLVLYIIYKIGSFFFRAGAASQHLRNQQPRNYNGNASAGKDKRKDGGVKDGEYIDYEEVK